MNEITNRILNRIPNFFDHEDKVLRAFIDCIAPEIQKLYDNIKIVEDIVSIDKVHDDDVFSRFGSMLGINKYSYESYKQYKSRVKSVVASKYGGIKPLIKNTVASYINITDSNLIEEHIHVYETATYEGNLDPSVSREPANFIVVIDSELLVNEDFVIPKQLKQIINGVKAAGVNAYTTYTFTVLIDDATINISDKLGDAYSIRTKYADTSEMKLFDNIRRDNISINDKVDGCYIGIGEESSLTNDTMSLTNYTMETNNIASYDIIRKAE